MTQEERKIANALLRCTFLPGSFDKGFVNQLPNWSDREMTKEGLEFMIKLFHKYRRQIPEYNKMCKTFKMLQKPKLLCEEVNVGGTIPMNFIQ